MICFTKTNLPLLIYCLFVWISSGMGKIFITEDKPYEQINIQIPQEIWRQALQPTPVLKSPVTIVVPVHVPDEDYIEDDEEIEDTVTEINQVANATIVNDEIVQDPVVANDTIVSETPVIEDDESTTAAPEQVTGQVFRFPCTCRDGQCGCCTGAILERFSTKACGNITFIPEDFVFDVRLSVNNNTVVRRRVSASDPPPICFNPRRAPFIQVCAEISNIRIRNRNAYACLDIEADIGGFPVYSASFRCFGLGSSGLQTGLKPKPVSSGPKPVSLFGSGGSDDDGGFIEDAASTVFGGGDGLFGGGDGLFGGSTSDAGGPLDGISDVVEDLFDGRQLD